MDTPDTKKLGQEPGVAPEPEPQPEPQPRPKADTFEAAPEKKLDWEQLRTGGSMASGTVLIVLGVLFALAQLLGIRLGHYMWPLFIIVPGLALFALATGVERWALRWRSAGRPEEWEELAPSRGEGHDA